MYIYNIHFNQRFNNVHLQYTFQPEIEQCTFTIYIWTLWWQCILNVKGQFLIYFVFGNDTQRVLVYIIQH